MANTNKIGSAVADQAKNTAGNMMDKAQETGGNMLDKAKDVAGNVAGKVGEAASWAGQRAEDAAGGMGSGMRSLGETIREKGPQGGILGGATSAVGGAFANAGSYLEDKGFSGIGSDLTELVRRNPIPALLMGVGLGFLLARLTSRG